MRTVSTSAALAVFVVLASLPARAEAPRELRYDLRIDVPVAAAATAAWIGSEALKAHLAPAGCRWCDRRADGTDALDGLDASVRRALVWSNTRTANTLSNVGAFVVTPALMLGSVALVEGHDGALDRFPVDALLIAEATALAADLNQTVKFIAGRERPFVHVLRADQKPLTDAPADNNLSFFSGHTTFVFAAVASTATVARLRGYSWAPWIWAVGLPLAAATGYLRIAADKHYFTDVATGAVIGTAMGIAVPTLFHRPIGRGATLSASAAPLDEGAAASLNMVW